MKHLLARWRRNCPPATKLLRADLRPRLARSMCGSCAKRWLAGRSLWHPWCAVELRHAFDLYFERLHDAASDN